MKKLLLSLAIGFFGLSSFNSLLAEPIYGISHYRSNHEPGCDTWLVIIWVEDAPGAGNIITTSYLSSGPLCDPSINNVFLNEDGTPLNFSELDPIHQELLIELLAELQSGSNKTSVQKVSEAAVYKDKEGKYWFFSDGLVNLDGKKVRILSVNGQSSDYTLKKAPDIPNKYELLNINSFESGTYFLIYESKIEGLIVPKTIQFIVS